MTVKMRDDTGILRTIKGIRMRDAGGVLRTIQRIRMRDIAGVLRTVYTYLSVALNAYTTYKSASGAASAGTVTSNIITGTVTGGTAPFTYAWEYVSGSLGISIDTPTTASTQFTTFTDSFEIAEAFFQLKVTDAVGAISYSPQLKVQLQWIDTR